MAAWVNCCSNCNPRAPYRWVMRGHWVNARWPCWRSRRPCRRASRLPCRPCSVTPFASMPTLPADATVPLRDDRAGRWAPWWVLAYVAMWPLPGIAETVLGLGALYAAARMVMRRLQRRPHLLSTAAWALTSILFLGYWLPQAFSAIDAIDPAASWTKAAAGLRYLPFMWLVAIAVATPERRRLTFGRGRYQPMVLVAGTPEAGRKRPRVVPGGRSRPG
ncbi:hypothetical protein G6F35_014230 [Rhizopus arrhizus]|nr:hypothetical protein G6F35_014230 [Rhizopus arrhizus]KAG1394226.1 hypothetical protein G6F59_014232 [Rhizopus arrhizus]